MHEPLEGQGELERWERPGDRFPVEYFFDIVTEVRDRPGFPSATARSHSSGRVTALSGKPLSEGYYRLFASDGEILKVKNLGFGGWVILAQ